MKIYRGKCLLIKSLNQVLRQLKSRHCSCLGRLEQSYHPSHFISEIIYTYPVVFRVLLARFNVGPFELDMRMLLGHHWHIAAICGNSLVAGLPQLQCRNKLLVLSSWEWSVSCHLRSDLCFRRMTALPSLKTFGGLPQFTGLRTCLFSVLTHSGSRVIGLLQFHLISRRGRFACKSSCSSMCTELLVSNLLQCISCYYLYLVCTSLILDKKNSSFLCKIIIISMKSPLIFSGSRMSSHVLLQHL